MSWKDHFSHASDDYRRWRPGYPDELFAWLASIAPSKETAWDCATGSGQAAGGLAAHFARVVATDASAAQVREAEPFDRVEYRVAPAERSPLDDRSIDLVTVAQALHWFDVDAFHAEVHRVLKPGGVIAEWGYGLALIGEGIDEAVSHFSERTVGPYWPPERVLVEEGYVSLSFPFERIDVPAFSMRARWDLARFLAYLGTWSSVHGYRRATGSDPLPVLAEELAAAWGDGEREIRWPLVLRAGRAPLP
jgi:SAM-dependent methyltransferase